MKFRLIPTVSALLIALGLLASSADAQPITSVRLNVYRQGQATPAIAAQEIPLASWACNQASVPAAVTPPTRNPLAMHVEDPNAPANWCSYTPPANGVFALVGYDTAQVYELSVAFVNSAGAGPDVRATFIRPGTPPTAAPARLRITPGQ